MVIKITGVSMIFVMLAPLVALIALVVAAIFLFVSALSIDYGEAGGVGPGESEPAQG